MAPPNDKPNNQKRVQEGKGSKVGRVIVIARAGIMWLFHYSGLEFIYRKFNPPKDSESLPTGVIFLIGIYVAFFGVASQRYENRIDIIENRANSIFAQLGVPSVQKKALSRIARVQNMTCPYKPNILNPHSVFISLFRDSKYEEMAGQLKETIEDWKDSLESVNLQGAYLRGASLGEANLRKAGLQGADLRFAYLWGADLQGAYLWGADLREADLGKADLREAILWFVDLAGAKLAEAKLGGAKLREADLRGAEELTVGQLCKASTLYKTKLDQELEMQIKQECPDVLKKEAPSWMEE